MHLLNEESIFNLFTDIEQLPNEAFIHSLDDITGMINTIMGDNAYYKQLALEHNQNPVNFLENIKNLERKREEFILDLNEKNSILLSYYEKMIEDGRDIIKKDGYFQQVPIKICLLDDKVQLPEYQHPADAGMDIHANEDISIAPFERTVVKTGFKVIIPGGYEIQIRSRSGLALKKGLIVANSPGTIDAPYRNEVGVILINTSNETIEISKGERIAQMVLNSVPQIVWNTVDEVEYSRYETERGEGFGSSGV